MRASHNGALYKSIFLYLLQMIAHTCSRQADVARVLPTGSGRPHLCSSDNNQVLLPRSQLLRVLGHFCHRFQPLNWKLEHSVTSAEKFTLNIRTVQAVHEDIANLRVYVIYYIVCLSILYFCYWLVTSGYRLWVASLDQRLLFSYVHRGAYIVKLYFVFDLRSVHSWLIN